MAPTAFGGIVRSKRLGLAAALLACPVIGAVVWTAQEGSRKLDLAKSCWTVVAFLVVFLVLTEAVGRTSANETRRGFGYLEVLIGADGYASTIKAVALLWTLIFASSLVLLSAMVWLGDLTPEKAFGTNWDAYLLLLGGPFATAVLAKGITVGKAETQTTDSTSASSLGVVGAAPPTEGAKPSLTDLGKSSTGESSLPDTQYVVSTLVAIAYFIGAFIATLNDFAGDRSVDDVGLPVIPEAMLGLTSLAALTYVGAKAVAKTGVRLVAVSPTPVPASGGLLEVTMVNASSTLTAGMITVLFKSTDGVTVATIGAQAPTRDGVTTKFEVNSPQLTAGTSYNLVVVTPDGTTPALPFITSA